LKSAFIRWQGMPVNPMMEPLGRSPEANRSTLSLPCLSGNTTREELEEMLEAQEDYEDDQRISLDELARFFPGIGDVQIDPGDY